MKATTQKRAGKSGSHKVAGERMVLKIRGAGFAFRWIPAGSFTMGSSPSEREEAAANIAKFGRGGNVETEIQRDVKFARGFWMLESPVTQRMWRFVMGFNPSVFKGSDRRPVENVSWNDCQLFAKTLNRLGVRPKKFLFALPTEAEWEYACRATTTTAFYFGDSLNGEQANCDGNLPFGAEEAGRRLGRSSEVGLYPANAWGLVDMHGNVREWCEDQVVRSSGEAKDGAARDGAARDGEAKDGAAKDGAAKDGAAKDGAAPNKGTLRVLRGGGWIDPAVYCRASFRGWIDARYRCGSIGARLVLRPVV